MKRIVSIGEIVWDMLPSGARLGGAPVNFAFFAQALGAQSYPVSAIGEDELGSEAMAILGRTGMNVSCIQKNGKPTGRVNVKLDANGVPCYEIVENVAWDAMVCTPENLALMRTADVVCWGSLAQRSAASRESILKLVDEAPQACLRVFDINLRQSLYSKELIEGSLRRADILKLNEDELPAVAEMFSVEGDETESIAALMKQFALTHVVFTRGSRDSLIYGAEGLLSALPTPEVAVVDTVGAGDSFTAAFVISILNGKSIASAHSMAVKTAAFVCTVSGAINPLPPSMAAD